VTSFKTAAEAQAFVCDRVDAPAIKHKEALPGGPLFHAFTQKLGNKFTNIYDVSYPKGQFLPVICVHDQLISTYDFAVSSKSSVVISGGFFFLADRCSGSPRQPALNLAITQGRIRSLPVVDREAVLSGNQGLSARFVRAQGILSLNNQKLSWSGSLTNHKTDVKIFGSGNCVIRHERNEVVGSIRVLDEHSRFTPRIKERDIVDIGCIAKEDGSFVAVTSSKAGHMDIFVHDVVVRCHKRYLGDGLLEMKVHTIDSLAVDTIEGALSVGPLIDTVNFDQHPINKDASLGSKPPFIERAMARVVLYETQAGTVHLRLFDGHPDSEVFIGVTPTQAVEIIRESDSIKWGCFLDPGKTAKLCVRTDKGLLSLGNTNYLKWATRQNEEYVWAPITGRPTASMIAL
jgi:hypothetical protein